MIICSTIGLDDFDDFQSAPAAAPPAAAAAAAKPKTTNDLFDLLGNDVFGAAPVAQAPPASASPAMSRPLSPSSSNNNSRPASMQSFAPTPVMATSQQQQQQQQSQQQQQQQEQPKAALPSGMWSQASAFVSLDSLGKSSGPAKPTVGPSMNAMKSSSANAGWNAWASSNQPATPSKPKALSPFDDLLS